MSKHPADGGITRRGFLGSSLGALAVGIGCSDASETNPEGSAAGGAASGGAPTAGVPSGGGTAATGGAPSEGGTTGSGGSGGGGGEAKVHLAAACGTYCGACLSYMAKHGEDEAVTRPNPWGDCDGCLSGGTLASHCRTCSIRLCAAETQSGGRCTDCAELPCYRITNLIDAGGYPHRQEYLPNLAKMRELGVEEWVSAEEERWRCPQCGLPMSWYDTECARCGAPRSASLFPVTADTPRPY